MGCGGSKVGVREVDVEANAKATEMAARVDELINAMSPHRLEGPLPESQLAEIVALLELAKKDADNTMLTQATDAVVADLLAVPYPTVQGSKAKLDEMICTGLHNPGSGVTEELVPLKTQLQCVHHLLQVYAHTTLSFCSLPALLKDEGAALGALSEMLVKPAVKHIKEAMRNMCERIESDLPYFQRQVAGKGAEDKAIYENLFKKFAGESADQRQRDAYRRVLAQIDLMKGELIQLKDGERPGEGQLVSDVLQLAVQFRACSGTFSRLATDLADGMSGVKLKQRNGLKDLYRMLEKGILKGPGTVDWKDALSPDVPVNCSNLLDGVGCIFLCQTFIDMDLLVEKMRGVIASLDEVQFYRIKNRWTNPTIGGWRDLLFNLVVKGVVVEVQIAHKELYFAREQWGHSAYGDVRCFQELLAFTGNEASAPAPEEDAGSAAYDIIFSHKTDQNDFVKGLIDRMPELRCFSQTDLDQTQNSWKLQWLEAYENAKICVCVLTKEYLLSGPCCLEWGIAAMNSKTRVVLAVDSPDDILASVDDDRSRCDENVDIYLHLRNGSPVLLKSTKTDQELCADIKRKFPKSQTHNAPLKSVSAPVHTAIDAASAIPVISDEPAVDILVIVDFPTHGGGGGVIEAAKYIAPFQALEAAFDAKFVGTLARIRFHTPRSVVEEDPDLLNKRIPCLCWIAMGEQAPAVQGSMFSTSLWGERGGGCDFAIVLMKHGAESLAAKMMGNGCADRVVWIAADYTAQSANGFLANGKSKAAAIPTVLRAALSGADFQNEHAGKICCNPILDLAKKRNSPAGIKMKEGCRSMHQVVGGEERPLDGLGITLSRTPSEPAQLTNTMVGVPHHSSVDLNQWSATCTILQKLKENRDGLHVVVVANGTETERKVVAWTAIQSYIAVAGRFDLVVYRDADLPVSTRELFETFDLPFDTHGDQDVLVWMDSRSDFPLETLREAINSYTEGEGMPLPWTFVLTSASSGLVDDVVDEFDGVSVIDLPPTLGTTVNESSEELIHILPVDPTLKVQSILEVVDATQLLDLLAAALPQTESDSAAGKDFLDQILLGNQNSVVLRGMAPNTKFLFELRNDLIDGSLDQRINTLLLGYNDKDALGGQKWKLDRSAFASIYPQILSQMDQLSSHQRDKLLECEAAQRVHVTGPAGCGKTFIALHMVVDLIKDAELASTHASCALSKESPILFVGKNKALCMFFVHWISDRLRKTKKPKEAKRLISTYLRVLHTSPFEDKAFALEFSSGKNNVEGVREKASANYSLVIVDEAHHIFAAGGNVDDSENVAALCTNAARSLLLSDISQGEGAADVVFPLDHKRVLLTEVVRNSSRIVTASLPFCRSTDLADVTCHHGVRGPPLEPLVFDNCGNDDGARYMNYVKGIAHGLQHMQKTFPGAEVHDNLVILVPNQDFRDAILPALTIEMSSRDIPISMVNAVDGVFTEPKQGNDSAPSRIVLDTLESFDGMERLFVFAVGLDSVRTTEGCCGIYRALTRAHMFVCVVQEHLPGGWLEFTATVQRDELVDFDEAVERERVARENLSVIASLDGAAVTQMAEFPNNDADADTDTGSNVATMATYNDDDGGGGILPASYEIMEGGGDEDNELFELRFAATGSLVRIQNVWNLNLNSEAFGATISTLTFDPLSNAMVCVGPFELPRASTSDEIEGFAHLLAKEKDASIPIAHRPYQVASAFFAALYMYFKGKQFNDQFHEGWAHWYLAMTMHDSLVEYGNQQRVGIPGRSGPLRGDNTVRGGMANIKEQVMQILDTGSLEIAASYFEGENPRIPHPLNQYKVNEAALKVTYNQYATELNTGKGVLRTPKENDECDVQVVCHGRSPDPSVAKTRALRLKFINGTWRVIGIQYILQSVVPPFKGEDVEITKDEFDREQNYRFKVREDFPHLEPNNYGFQHFKRQAVHRRLRNGVELGGPGRVYRSEPSGEIEPSPAVVKL